MYADLSEYQDEAWEVIRASLSRLSSHRKPSGDYVRYLDYFPNALGAVQRIYGIFFTDDLPEIEDYELYHLEESCGHDITQMVVGLIIKAKVNVLTDESLNDDTYTEFLGVPNYLWKARP